MEFVKMHGLGNDFVIINNLDEKVIDYRQLAKSICNRHFGVGADGVIIVLPSEAADIKMRIFNSDGSEAEMCGNGIRCFSKYVYDYNIIEKTSLTVDTLAGIMKPELIINDDIITGIRVNMGKPLFDRQSIPMFGEGDVVIDEDLELEDKKIKVTSMLMGVPHTVVFVENLQDVDIQKLGSIIEKHRVFPKKTNVNFVQVIDRSNIKVRTWERGAGLTLACGTGACASVVASTRAQKTDSNVTVRLVAGTLNVELKVDGYVYMTGPAEYSFKGILM